MNKRLFVFITLISVAIQAVPQETLSSPWISDLQAKESISHNIEALEASTNPEIVHAIHQIRRVIALSSPSLEDLRALEYSIAQLVSLSEDIPRLRLNTLEIKLKLLPTVKKQRSQTGTIPQRTLDRIIRHKKIVIAASALACVAVTAYAYNKYYRSPEQSPTQQQPAPQPNQQSVGPQEPPAQPTGPQAPPAPVTPALHPTDRVSDTPVVTHPSDTLDHQGLFKDFERYARDVKNFVTYHEDSNGSVLLHSIWVAQTMEKWIKEKKFWIPEDLTAQEQRMLVASAFLHDIGKGGDQKLSFGEKPTHPQTGKEMLLGTKPYIMKDETPFDFNSYLRTIGLSANEQRTMAALIATHHNLEKVRPKSENKQKIYLQKLKKACDDANICMSEKVLRMAVALSAADVRGISEVTTPVSSPIFTDLAKKRIIPSAQRIKPGGTNFYRKFHMETTGKAKLQALVRLFRASETGRL